MVTMKVKIQVTITKKTAKKTDYAEFIENFAGEFREGKGSQYDYLDFGPFTMTPDEIEKFSELFDFLKGPAIRSIVFIDVRKNVFI